MTDNLMIPVLRLLSNGRYHSILDISRVFCSSFEHIAIVFEEARKFGVVIHRYNDNFLWVNIVSLLDGSKINLYISMLDVKFDLTLFDCLVSTSSYLLEYTFTRRCTFDKYPLFVAELQTDGRGTRGKKWHSGIGSGLTFSFVWSFNRTVDSLSGLSLVIGLAILRVLRSLGINGVTLKWPNDILYNGKKLCGILLDFCGFISRKSVVVIGIGINVNFSSKLADMVGRDIIDLSSISNRCLDRDYLLAILLVELSNILHEFDGSDFSRFMAEWNNLCAYKGQHIVLNLPDGSAHTGVVDGVDDKGRLVLVSSLGFRSSFSSGEFIVL